MGGLRYGLSHDLTSCEAWMSVIEKVPLVIADVEFFNLGIEWWMEFERWEVVNDSSRRNERAD
jgi:hypothetical protein